MKKERKQLLTTIGGLVLFPVAVGIFCYLLWGSMWFGIFAGGLVFMVFPVEFCLSMLSSITQTGNPEMTWTSALYERLTYLSLPVGTIFLFWGLAFEGPTIVPLFVFLLVEYSIFFFGIRGQRITNEGLLDWYKDMLPVVAILWAMWAIFAPVAYKPLAAPLLLMNVAEAMRYGYIRFK